LASAGVTAHFVSTRKARFCHYGKRRVAALPASGARQKARTDIMSPLSGEERMCCRSFCVHINEI
jgi:hypothetical protein